MRQVASARNAYFFVSVSLLLLMSFLVMSSSSLRQIDQTRRAYEDLTREWFLLRLAVANAPMRRSGEKHLPHFESLLDGVLNSEALRAAAQLSDGLESTIRMLQNDWEAARPVVARHLADPGGELTQTEAQRLIQVESGLMVLQAHLGETIRSQQRALEVVLYVLGATIIAIIGIFWLVERESSIHRVAAARVKSFAQTAIGTQEQERARLARALHDTLAQELSVMLLQLEEQPFSDERRMQFKNRLLDSVAWLRNLSYELHPAEISQVGLGCAMKSYCEETGNRRHADIECEIEEPLAPLAESVAINIYRIGQEAVTNALKHARASRILLTLCEKNGQIELVVEDDGLGFRPADVARRREGLGLIGMRERATIAGGTLQIQSAEGEGTRIVFIASRGAGSGRREGEWNGSTYRSARG